MDNVTESQLRNRIRQLEIDNQALKGRIVEMANTIGQVRDGNNPKTYVVIPTIDSDIAGDVEAITTTTKEVIQ